jgi:hypothetical protein
MSCIAMIPSPGFTASSFVFNETPIGATNCLNLFFTTQYKILSGTLKVRIDGVNLDEKSFLIGADNQSFTLVLNPSDRDALNHAPSSSESIRVDYIKDTTTGGCVLSL